MPQVLLNRCDIDDLFQKWKRKYGGIFTFWMGPIPMVMVGDVETMKRYFVRHGDVFSGRWKNFITDTFMGESWGGEAPSGSEWEDPERMGAHSWRRVGDFSLIA